MVNFPEQAGPAGARPPALIEGREAMRVDASEQLLFASLQPDHGEDALDPRLRDLREANAQLVIAALTAQELEAKAEHAHTQQIRFLAMVAHELRNPLTPIRTVSLLLNHAGLDKPQLARLQGIIERQVAHISRLIDDLLDGSRVSAGKFQLKRQPIELAEVLDAAVQMCKPAMDKRLQRLAVSLPLGPVRIEGDAVRLTQVFSNLLDNASKYTPDGGEIQLILEQQEGMATVKVADNGVGISAMALPCIFDLFVQDATASAFAQTSPGLGIGLAVVRELVEAHGGNVVATSQGRNLGSEFVVTLPGI
ncbi:HAMP domain-containing sensor histidine kinase [Aquabacterium sp.]|uniref:sensor histidine kinase n=1 Tax=Aquabacterium sp. TaxID=1872578 RepID=UPI0019CEB0B8|nr:HAMP domain-containing sensor histidine kinase [Aquabacterium sp.]MBC7701173.1 HAMP domain-containing histidine kinase [Aquabacterium sp.]